MIFFGEQDGSVVESEARLVLESERGVECDDLDSESDESVSFDRECNGLFL
jgi:hypothetical protein